jgi:ABC-type bacteriocin/lantibiotic exporter with double-glycine peptidase domain
MVKYKIVNSKIKLARDVVGPLKALVLLVLLLMILDSLLASIGLGMLIPLFQAILTPDQVPASLAKILPILTNFSKEERLLYLSIFITLLFSFKTFISLMSTYCGRTFSQKIWLRLLEGVGSRYLLASYSLLQTEKHGEKFNNWFNETVVAARFFSSLLSFLSSTLLMGFLIITSLLVNLVLTLSFLFLMALGYLALKNKIFRSVSSLGSARVKSNQVLGSNISETLSHIRELKLMGAEYNRLAVIKKNAKVSKSVFVRLNTISQVPQTITELVTVIMLILLVYIALYLLGMTAHEFLPTLIFFTAILYKLTTTGSEIVAAKMKMFGDFQSLQLVSNLISQKDVLEDLQDGFHINKINSIHFFNVSFGYKENNEILDKLNLELPIGKLIYLIGKSGSGKSTFLDLLLRLRQPRDGEIIANGQNINEFNLKDWRKRFGYVSQEASLFNGSIRMNMQLVKSDVSNEELDQVFNIVGLRAYVKSLKEGYDTVVGDHGYILSGGQRKRVAIARALLNEPDVLILDEATTSFEQSLEVSLLNQIKDIYPFLTIILITHRLDSIDDNSVVLILKNGHVSERKK